MSSNRPLVYVDGPVHQEALDALQEKARVVTGFGPEARSLEEVLPEVEGILMRTGSLPERTVNRARALRVIARHGVGVDNISVEAASKRGIPVLITPKANLRSVAEHVFALGLAVSRNLLLADKSTRAGLYLKRDQMVGRELFGTRMGVIGFGRIGREVARIARNGFSMKVVSHDPNLTLDQLRSADTEPTEELEDLLSRCELVSVHVPLTPRTRGLIGEREIACMQPGSILIQASRGGVVDEAALLEALRSGHLAGAGIDVFDQEPPPKDHPFFSMPQVVLTPHTAAHTHQALRNMSLDAARGILDVLTGSNPSGNDWKAWESVNADSLSMTSTERGAE